MFRRSTLPLLLLPALVLAILVFSAVPALGASPWWHLSSGAFPSYLKGGVGKSEVQDVTVAGSPGDAFVLANLTAAEVKEMNEKKRPYEKFVVLRVGEEPGAIQVGLEGIYGAGNVEVTGSPGARVGLEPYVVTFKNALAEQPVRAINSELSPLVGFGGNVTVTEAVVGRSDGQLLVTAYNLGDASTSGELTISDTLPAGVRATSVIADVYKGNEGRSFSDAPVKCELGAPVTCRFAGTLVPYAAIEVRIVVVVEPGAKMCEQNAGTCERNVVSVSGGAAPSALISRPVTINESRLRLVCRTIR